MSTSSLNPNRKPFPRGAFLQRVMDAGLVERLHPLQRSAVEPHFRKWDPANWPHTLGAMDVLMDNLGMLMGEQHAGHDFWDYSQAVTGLLLEFEAVKSSVLPGKPWTGKNLLGQARKAHAGEPRPILRLMEEWLSATAGPIMGEEPSDEEGHKEDFESVLPIHGGGFADIPWHRMLPDGWQPPDNLEYSSQQSRGIILPDGFKRPVPPNRVLHPREATPDLPMRVGLTAKDARLYRRLVRDQGQHGTCAAHAVATGLTLAAHRAGHGRVVQDDFSPAWLHNMSARAGEGWPDGRTLSGTVDAVRELLPCGERVFPYASGPTAGPGWRTTPRMIEAQLLTGMLGRPEISKIGPAEIAQIKTLLAAGWVVVVSATHPQRWSGRAMNRYGMPLVPLEGDRPAVDAHAWLLVGYDHVDGNQQWKYQGRFWALNSWGPAWPKAPIWGPGLCSLPFSAFLTEGIEAYALRFDVQS